MLSLCKALQSVKSPHPGDEVSEGVRCTLHVHVSVSISVVQELAKILQRCMRVA